MEFVRDRGRPALVQPPVPSERRHRPLQSRRAESGHRASRRARSIPICRFILFTKDKKPVGSLSVFALHLDTVGGTEYSADYPGHLAAELRREFGDEFISVFGTGTCGDINHIDVSGQRRYNARLIGQQLAIDILSARPRVPLIAPR